MSDVSRRNFLKAAAGTVTGVIGAGVAASAVRAAGQLSNEEIIRAWKDEAFRDSLTEDQRSQLPNHPSGQIEIDDKTLDETILAGRTIHRSRGRCCY